MSGSKNHYDIIIIGAGIAGTSLAYELASDHDVLILEQEYAPGYHATGRSAAFSAQTYGGPDIEPLTSASRAFLKKPPMDFWEDSFLGERGAINIGRSDELYLAHDMIENFKDNGVELSLMQRDQLEDKILNLRSDWAHAVWEPDCCDIDVGSLHQAYISNAKKRGVEIICSNKFETAQHIGAWAVETDKARYSSKILINAAGAWADQVAEKSNITPIGITPLRRTMVELEIAHHVPEDLPLIVALDGSFYFKAMPNNHIWLSPHDETISQAKDVSPEEMDVAIAIDRFQNIVDWEISKISYKWAGLRSFSPDRLPVIGFDQEYENYFWFVGQGGFGIQTSPVTSQMGACLLRGNEMPAHLTDINYEKYAPNRFSK